VLHWINFMKNMQNLFKETVNKEMWGTTQRLEDEKN
jgi:hypothetical protein